LQVKNHLSQVNEPGMIAKRVRAVDLELVEIVNPNVPETEVKIKLTTVVVAKITLFFANCDFDSTDYWEWWADTNCVGGKCGPFAGQGNPCSYAANEINKKINRCSGIPRCPFFVSIFQIHLTPGSVPGTGLINPNDPTPNDNSFDYLLFFNDPALPNFHTCLNPDEMNFYKQNVINKKNQVQSQISSDRFVFSSALTICDASTGCYPVFGNYILHELFILQGKCA